MPVAIKKYKFHIIKTEFYRFIIKLKKLSIDPSSFRLADAETSLGNTPQGSTT